MTFAGHKPVYYLPVIPPPPTGSDSTAYYLGLGVVVTAVESGVDSGLALTLPPAAPNGMYSMFGGELRYIPPGGALPFSSNSAPAGGALVLELGPAEINLQWRRRPAGANALRAIIYAGIDAASVTSAIQLLVPGVNRKLKVIAWKNGHAGVAPTPNDDLDTAYLNQFMAGLVCITVDGGARIGTVQAFAGVEIRCANALVTPTYESPIGVFRNALAWEQPPYLSLWTSHPLVEAMAQFPASAGPPANNIPPPASFATDITKMNGNYYGPDGKRFAVVNGKGARTPYQDGTTINDYINANLPLFQNIHESRRKVMAGLSDVEGRMEAINSYDTNFLTFGCGQWTAGQGDGEGELPGLLEAIRAKSSTVYHDYFGAYNLDLHTKAGASVAEFFKLPGKLLNTATLKEEHLRTPLWAYRFSRAGYDPVVRECEIRYLNERILRVYNTALPSLPGKTIGEVVTSQYGMALLLDQHINRPSHFSGGNNFLINKAVGEYIAANPGLANTLPSWTDSNEKALIAIYVAKRQSFPAMTSSADRVNKIKAYITKIGLSESRHSFKLS